MSSEFVKRVQSETQTALSRLGSSKALYAETAGELDAEQVLRAAAVAEAAASETFRAWAADEADSDAAGLFAAVADEEADHYRTVANEVADLSDELPEIEGDALPAIQSVLREFETTIERAGGLVGRCLVANQSKQQYTGYFVGDADPQTAGVFRELGEDVDDQLQSATALVATVCEDDADREQAAQAAIAAVEAAYEEYTSSLNELGVDPKPVC